MASISLTPADVRVGANMSTTTITGGEASIEPGDLLYNDSGKYKRCINTSEAAAAATHVALTYGGLDDKIAVGEITNNSSYIESASAAWVAGEVYITSTVAGEMMPAEDIASSGYVNIVGVAESTTAMKLFAQSSGISK